MTEISIQYPVDTVRCFRGDYVLRRSADGLWEVFLVEDVLCVSRLVRLGSGDSATLTEERALLDSVAPAYHGEIHLLLTSFEPCFATAEQAAAAIGTSRLTARVTGLLRDIREFPLSTSHLIAPS